MNVGDILSDVYTGMAHKNPQVKLETTKWLMRCLLSPSISKKDLIPKTEVKPLVEMLLKGLDDGLEAIRETSAESLAVLTLSLTERTMNPYLERLDKVKQNKVQDFSSKLKVGKSSPLTEIQKGTRTNPSSPAPQRVSEPAVTRAPPTKSATARRPPIKSKTSSKASLVESREASQTSLLPDISSIRYEFNDSSAEEYVTELWPGVVAKLTDSNWKIRLEAVTELSENVKQDNIKAEGVIKCLLKIPGWKESNFQVASGMCTIFATLASNSSFNAGCAFLLTSGLVNKLGDNKVKKIAGECLEKMAQATSLELIFSETYETLNKQKSPKFIADALLWMNTTLREFAISGINIRDLIQFLKSTLGNTNNTVRSNSVTVLTTIRQFSGPKIRDLLNDVSPAILSTIDAEFQKFADVAPPAPVKQQVAVAAVAKTSSVDNLFPKVDISNKITSEISKQMGDANWKERKIALDSVLQIIEETHYRIQPILGSDFLSALKSRLSDSNKNLASSAVEISGFLATSIGKPFEKHLRQLIPLILTQLCDQKSTVRQIVLVNLDKINTSIGFSSILSYVATHLMNENPYSRKDLLKWTCDQLDTKDNLEYTLLVHPSLACIQDRNADVRKLAMGILAKLAEHITVHQLESIAGDLYRGSALTTVMSSLETVKNEVVIQAHSAPVVHAPRVVEEKQKTHEESIHSKAPKKILKMGSTLSLKKEVPKEVVADVESPIISTDLKHKEARAHADRGVLKWSFESPRRELIDMLSEQASSHLSPSVCALLFSTDHYKEKDFLTGLKVLDDFMVNPGDISKETLGELCIANCDILLKYLTIRFFDTNTTILLKCLEFLEHFLAVLDESSYQLNDYEAGSFLPFFVQKTGDPKETLRVKFRSIMKQLARVYPASKLFLQIMKGLDSKNSRTRTECLDEIASLLQRSGSSVFNASKSLPLIVSQVSDRDSSVRNASLGAICQAYLLLGDDIYKSIGRLADKEKGIIMERIRRLPSPAAKIAFAEPVVTKAPEIISKNILLESRKKPLDAVAPLKKSLPIRTESPSTDSLVIAPIKSIPKEFSLDFDNLDAPVLQSISARSSRAATPVKPLSRPLSRSNNYQPSHERLSEDRLDLLLDVVISKIETSEADELMDALKQMEKIITAYPDNAKLRSNDIVKCLTVRSQNAFSRLAARDGSQQRLCKHLQGVFVHLFSNQEIAASVPANTLEQCIREILLRLVDPDFQKAEGGSGLSRALNVLMVRIIENGNSNATFRSLLHILQESSLADSASHLKTKYSELSMKCLWKVTKIVGTLITSRKLIVEDLLFDIHEFLLQSPPQHWKKLANDTKNEQADMPLRTVKTILHEVVNNLGVESMHYAAVLPNQHQNHVVNYLRQMVLNYEKKNQSIRNPSLNQSNVVVIQQPTQSTESADITKRLDDIFAMISDKELTKQGIQHLHEFQKHNPGAFLLIETRLSQTGSYFQGYIRRGLASLTQSEMAVGHKGDAKRLVYASPFKATVEGDADTYKETLAKLQRMFVGKETKVF